MVFLLEGTVPTGLEPTALEEVQEKLNVSGTFSRGRVYFEVHSMEQISETLKFGSFEHVNVVILKTKEVTFSSDRDECYKKIRSLVQTTSWLEGLLAWQACFGDIPGSLSKALNKLTTYKAERLLNPENFDALPACVIDKDGPRFRVTCHREGKDFCFISNEAAFYFGGEMHNCFRWKPDMEKFDLEIILRINKDEIIALISLVKKCLSFRNVIERGPTCLKGAICYGLLRLCHLQTGDIVCDPMMGSGAILLEGFRHWPQCYYIGGDICSSSSKISFKNKTFFDSKLNDLNQKASNIELFSWNVTKLPLKSSSIDCFVSDLPFGKRSGSQMDNRKLYPNLLNEMARVVRNKIGRAILLTYDRRSMVQSLHGFERYFTLKRTLVVNVGGLFSGVYILQRTANDW